MAKYRSFEELAANETDGVDYRIRERYGLSGIAVIAIHGGGIEPGTTEIAEAVAGERHAFYTFSGLKPSGNACLHITSRHFNEPRGLRLVQHARTVVSIHGCGDTEPVVLLGGRFVRLGQRIGGPEVPFENLSRAQRKKPSPLLSRFVSAVRTALDHFEIEKEVRYR